MKCVVWDRSVKVCALRDIVGLLLSLSPDVYPWLPVRSSSWLPLAVPAYVRLLLHDTALLSALSLLSLVSLDHVSAPYVVVHTF